MTLSDTNILDLKPYTHLQITHIQFLTLLYPSKFTVRLIYACLSKPFNRSSTSFELIPLVVPMVFASGALQFLELHPNQAIQDIAYTGAHVCSAATYILFTVALFVWGCFVNRKRAWRFDGGTAVFGGATLSLALFSTTLYILYVATEHLYRWLSGLLSTVVVWQSFFGWWWWVGTGSGSALSDLNEDPSVKQMILHVGLRAKRKRAGPRAVGATHSNAGVAAAPRAEPPRGWRSHLPVVVIEWCNALGRAHRAAEREQTVEQAERILEMERGGMIPLSRFNFRVSRRKRKYKREEQRLGDDRRRRDEDSDGEMDDWVPDHASEPARHCNTTQRESMLWWGPLRRWRLHDTTSYP